MPVSQRSFGCLEGPATGLSPILRSRELRSCGDGSQPGVESTVSVAAAPSTPKICVPTFHAQKTCLCPGGASMKGVPSSVIVHALWVRLVMLNGCSSSSGNDFLTRSEPSTCRVRTPTSPPCFLRLAFGPKWVARGTAELAGATATGIVVNPSHATADTAQPAESSFAERSMTSSRMRASPGSTTFATHTRFTDTIPEPTFSS